MTGPEQPVFANDGLLPVIAQDRTDGTVLMLAWADAEALRLTLETGEAHYFSRSRGELWRKGATSGNTQQVAGVRLDCDGDALLYLVDQKGPACHTGSRSCFFRELAPGEYPAHGELPAAARAVQLLDGVIADRLARLPEGSYVTELHRRGTGYIAQKVVEEAGETIVAALQGRTDELAAEAADLLFHLAVLLAAQGSSLEDPARVLLERHSGAGGR